MYGGPKVHWHKDNIPTAAKGSLIGMAVGRGDLEGWPKLLQFF